MPEPAAPSKGGLNLKRLPPWAWVIAIAGGAVIGFFLLKRPSGQAEEDEGGESAEGAGGRGGGAGGAIPALSDDQLSALGLTSGYQAPSYGDGVSSNEEGSSGDGFTDTGLGPVGPSGSQLTPAQSTAQTSLGGPTYNAPSTTTSSAGALGAGPTSGGTISSPTGGGSGLFKAQ